MTANKWADPTPSVPFGGLHGSGNDKTQFERIVQLERDLAAAQRQNDDHAAYIAGLEKDLAAAQESLKAARLFIVETGHKLADRMYAEADNRDGLATDCKRFATGEVCAEYLDVKWQTDRAIRAEERAQAAEARAESYKATIDRARRVMGGEGVEDQGQAWDQCLRILDAAIDAAIAGEPS